MKRKVIAVCVTGFDLEYETDVVRGVHNKCMELGLDILVFYNPTRKPQRGLDLVISEPIFKGEMQVYRLMDYDMIDGIVIFGESLLDENMFFEIARKASEHGVPLINVDDMTHEGEKRVIMSNKYAMSSVVEHLITVHGLTKIDFINGFKEDNVQSEERLEAYRTTLEKHGIPYDENRVWYGNFWRKAYECTEEILQKPELPEAIVCANDTMAFFCMDCLKEHGIRIPDDIIVTGFDSLKDCSNYIPMPTTVKRDTFGAGEAAVEQLLKMMNGEQTDDDTFVDSVLVKGQSCGCIPIKHRDEVSYEQRYSYYNDFKEFTRYLLDMNNDTANVTESAHLFDSLFRGAGIFKFSKMYVCVSSDVEKTQNTIDVDKDIPPWNIPETMVSMFQYGHKVPIGYEFPTKQLIPGGIGDEEAPAFFCFAPLYFKDMFLGYMVGVPSTCEIEGDLLTVWLTTISNNTGSFYMNNKLEKALGELELLNLHDPLTGLYNRRGLKKYEEDFVKKVRESGKYLSVICADVDGLKIINDAYGHEEGDVAITACSNTLMKVFPKDSICVRTGGDEFLILASVDSPEEPDEMIKEVYKRMEEYTSARSGGYKIGCSCGHMTLKPDDSTALNEVKSEADSRMYLEKHRRKTIRKF